LKKENLVQFLFVVVTVQVVFLPLYHVSIFCRPSFTVEAAHVFYHFQEMLFSDTFPRTAVFSLALLAFFSPLLKAQ